MEKINSSIIYRGPSLIDPNENIVVIAIVKSSNTKTGNMVQTYILCDNGNDPMLNNKLGLDFSICGNCKHRGTPVDINATGKHAKGRTCYVKLFQGVLHVWKHLQKGGYPVATAGGTRIGGGSTRPAAASSVAAGRLCSRCGRAAAAERCTGRHSGARQGPALATR